MSNAQHSPTIADDDKVTYVGKMDCQARRRLPLLTIRWLEDTPHQGRRRSPITRPGYRKGQKPPNHGRKFPPEPLTETEVLRLLDQCDLTTKRGVRNRALLVLLWRTGLRISEALDLKPHHVDFETKRVLVVCGKGSKTRTVAIDTGALMEISRWLMLRATLNVPARAPLFCTVNQPNPGRHVHSAYVRELCRELGEQAGIPKRVHPHGFRHTMAVELARAGYPLRFITNQLGHSSAGTTDTYLRGMGVDEGLDQIAERDWPEATS